MTDKEKIHQILSSLWKSGDNSVGKTYYNQALQDVQTAIDLQEEPISEELEKKNKIEILADIIFNAAKHGYMPYDTQDEYCAMEIARKNIDKFIIPKKQEEPVSNPIDFEQELYKAFGQVKDFTLCMRIAKWFYNMGKNSQEPVGEDLGEYINELSKQFPEVSFAKLSRIAVRVAKWQITKLMKDATEVTVHIDAGGYPYTPEIELYDYDKDVPLAKEGDKYKVILIKEDSV